MKPPVPGRVRHTIAWRCTQADCLPFTLCRRGLALLWHTGTPPGVIMPRFSRCPFLVNHNIGPLLQPGRPRTALQAYRLGALLDALCAAKLHQGGSRVALTACAV